MNECRQVNCPFRSNHSTSVYACEHIACPNRDDGFIRGFLAPGRDLVFRRGKPMTHKDCYGKCRNCVWTYNGGCSEWRNPDGD